MKPEQENLLLRIMSKVSEKLEQQQSRWWTYAATIYGILIFLLGGVYYEYRVLNQEMTAKTHYLELRIQKLETISHFELEHKDTTVKTLKTEPIDTATFKPDDKLWDSLTVPKK